MTSNSSQVDLDRDVGVEPRSAGQLWVREQEREREARGKAQVQGHEEQGREMELDRDVGVVGEAVGKLWVREQEREREVRGQEVQGKVGRGRRLVEDEGVGGGLKGEEGMERRGHERDRVVLAQDGEQQLPQQQGADGGEGGERAGGDQGWVGALPPGSVYPGVAALPYCDVVLRPGQMLYIPPGWWHFVRSLSVSFSVSFWWG